jgi:WXG100 family type VII secretion target
MTDRIAVTQGAMRAGADAVHATHDDVADTVGRIQGELDELRPTWTGSAADSHAALMQRWEGDVDTLRASLRRLEDALRGAERDQEATEATQQATIAGLGGMMSGGTVA